MSNVVKRNFYLLLVICVASALAGWVATLARVSYLQREAAEKAKSAAMIAAKRPEKYFADLVRAADEIVIADMNGFRPDWLEYRLSNKVRLSQLADILGDASYQAIPPGRWSKSREIRIYQMHEEVLALMSLNGHLHAHGKEVGGDFLVGEQTTDAIDALAEEIEPDPTRQPTTRNASQGYESSSAQGTGASSQDAVYNPPTFSDLEQELQFYKDYAYKALGGFLKVPDRNNATVEVHGDDILVIFPDDEAVRKSKYPGTYGLIEADYLAKVFFNKMTGKVAGVVRPP